MLMVGLPLLVFLVIPLHVGTLIPEWFGSDWAAMVTLMPAGTHRADG